MAAVCQNPCQPSVELCEFTRTGTLGGSKPSWIESATWICCVMCCDHPRRVRSSFYVADCGHIFCRRCRDTGKDIWSYMQSQCQTSVPFDRGTSMYLPCIAHAWPGLLVPPQSLDFKISAYDLAAWISLYHTQFFSEM